MFCEPLCSLISEVESDSKISSSGAVDIGYDER